jgi:hypothetical protein
MTTTVGLSITAPTNVPSGTVAHTTITATASTSETVQATATDTTVVYRVAGVVLSTGLSTEGTAGSLITLTHAITNTGPITDVFDVEAVSQRSWPVALLDEEQISQTMPFSLELGELGASHFVVGIRAPEDVCDGCSDHVTVTARSSINPAVMACITDTVTIRSRDTYSGFLPLAQSDWPPADKLGVDFGYMAPVPGVVEYDFPLTKGMGADWMRVFVRWRDVELAPGEYAWEQYDPVLERIGELGMKAIVVIHAAPDWAAQLSCGPISDTVALESFLHHLVPRYAEMTGAWEFINEPDGKEPHKLGDAIGCWGPHPDEYARQLQIFHSTVNDLDPSALVFFGGLAYDNFERSFQRTFFADALQSGAGPYFDGVSLHYYPINPEEFPTMAHKVNEIQDTMRSHGVEDKRIWVTETGMWVNRWGNVEIQSDFIVKEFSRGFGAGVDNIFWFDPREHDVGEGVHRWLINEDHEPVNGYSTFQHFARRREGLHCTGAYTDVPDGVEAYAFSGPARLLYVLWSESANRTVSIMSDIDGVLINRDGTESIRISASGSKLTFEVGTKPVFLEIRTQDAHLY